MTSVLRLSAAFAALLACSPAFAQGAPAPSQGAAPGPGGQQQPSGPAAGQAPGPSTPIIGPKGSFRLTPDGEKWARFQTVRAIGVSCTDKNCGGDRVFCMIQVRAAADAKPAGEVPADSAKKLGDGLIGHTPKEMKAEWAAPFAPKTIGGHKGLWGEIQASGEPGSVHSGLFMVAAEGHEVAFNCVAPADKWTTHLPKIEQVIASLEITK